MGQTLSFSTKVEIRASPATVRAVFIEFNRYPQWKPSWIIKHIDSDGAKPGADLQKGDRLSVSMDGKAHQPVVVENTPDVFSWEGSLLGVGAGVHQFRFRPSESTPGGTTFTNGEDFRGPAVALVAPFIKGREHTYDMSPWTSFNDALKKEAERRAAEVD